MNRGRKLKKGQKGQTCPEESRHPSTDHVGTETQTANTNGNGNGSVVKSLVEHVEQIKENLKNVIRDLTTVIDAVKAAEKEKRTSDKEIDAIRTKLRQIQSVSF